MLSAATSTMYMRKRISYGFGVWCGRASTEWKGQRSDTKARGRGEHGEIEKEGNRLYFIDTI